MQMKEILFDIKPKNDQVRVTVRFACLISRKGNDVRYTDRSDSDFTTDLLNKGIGRMIYPGDLRWYTPDLALVDYLIKEQTEDYRKYEVDYAYIVVRKVPQEKERKEEGGIPLFHLPPSPCQPLSESARQADFIERIEEIKENRAKAVIIGVAEESETSRQHLELMYRSIKACGKEHPDYQFIVLTDRGEMAERLFVLPENISIYRPQDLQALLPLCDLALTTSDGTAWMDCTFAHVPNIELTPRDLHTLTPRKLDRKLKDGLQNHAYLVDRQRDLCGFYEAENQKLDQLADQLIARLDRQPKRNVPYRL